jgi:hypothetical protein
VADLFAFGLEGTKRKRLSFVFLRRLIYSILISLREKGDGFVSVRIDSGRKIRK